MSKAIIRGTRAVAITSGGPTQDIIVPGIGTETPAAAMVCVTNAISLSGAVAAQAQQSIGLLDGSSQGCIAGTDQDNIPTTNTTNVSDGSNAIRMLNQPGTATNGVATATLIPGGIRLTWSQLPTTAFVVNVVCWFGDDITAAWFSATPDTTGNPAVAVNVGFEPDHLVTLATENTELDQVIRDGYVCQVAHATNLHPGISQFAAEQRSLDNSGSGNVRMILAPDELCRTQLSGNEQTRLVQFTATGFEIDSNGGGTGPTIIGLAIAYGGKSYDLNPQVSPTLLGDAVFAVGFAPSSFLGVGVAVEDTNWDKTVLNDEASYLAPMCYAGETDPGSDDADQFAPGTVREDGETESNTSTRSFPSALHVRFENDQVVLYDADLSSFGTTGYTLTFNIVPINPNTQFLAFLLEEDPLVGSGDQTLPSMQCAGTGITSTSGGGDKEFGAMQCAGQGVQIFAGGGDKPLSLPDCAGSGVLLFAGTSNFVVPKMQCAGTADPQVFTGGSNQDTDEVPQKFRPMELAGQGTVTLGLFEGGGDKKIGPLDCAGQGVLTFVGSGDTQLPSMTFEGLGGFATGTGDSQAAAMLSNGQGAQVFPGGGDKATSVPVHEGQGALVFQGGGDMQLGSMTSTGAGAEVYEGAGDTQLPATACEGVGTMQPEGDGGQDLPSMEHEGDGALVFTGSGDSVLPAIAKGEPQPSGFVKNFVGSGDKPLAIPAMAGAGEMQFAGASSAELPSLQKEGAGQLVFSGSGNTNFGAMSCAGNGADKVSGSGDFQVPALTCAGSNKPLTGSGSSITASPDPDSPITGSP